MERGLSFDTILGTGKRHKEMDRLKTTEEKNMGGQSGKRDLYNTCHFFVRRLRVELHSVPLEMKTGKDHQTSPKLPLRVNPLELSLHELFF